MRGSLDFPQHKPHVFRAGLFIGTLVVAIGIGMLVAFTGPLRETIRGAMSDWTLGHHGELSQAEAPMASFSAFWNSGGWGWIALLGLFGMPGGLVVFLGTAILISAVRRR